jgi:ubiquinone/menaquinone biosynthesis C-methylase UbiE
MQRGASSMRSDEYNMKTYWEERFEKFGGKDAESLSAFQVAGMPLWYNRFFVYTERLALKNLFNLLNQESFAGITICDVGCGVGTWIRYYALRGATEATGVDVSSGAIRRARKLATCEAISFIVMSGSDLGFKDDAFDVVSVIKVLQHFPYTQQKRATAEICRVTKKAGFVIVLETLGERTAPSASHVFRNTIDQWVEYFEQECTLISVKGLQYMPLLRFFQSLISKALVNGREYRTVEGDNQNKSLKIPNVSCWKMIEFTYYLVLRFIIIFSYPLERFCLKILSPERATHAVFLFKKKT